MTTLDAFMPDHRPTPREVARHKAAIEARHPETVPDDLLMLDMPEYAEAYRKRYNIRLNAKAILAWYAVEKKRERHMEREGRR